MKYFVFALVLLAGYMNLNAQNITKVEYSFDEFVKQGEGTVVSLSEEKTEVNSEWTIDISSLDAGVHTLYVRTQNDDGIWSLPTQQTLYVTETNVPETITEIEYAIDEFVKQGEGTNVLVKDEESVIDSVLTVNVASLEAGNHSIYYRTKNNFGAWSLPAQGNFHLTQSDTAKINSVYYRFTNDDYEGSWLSTSIDPERELLDSAIAVSTSALDIEEQYSIEFYAVNTRGERGFSASLEDVDLLANNSPETLMSELNIEIFVGESISVCMDSLFSDQDISYGDQLLFALNSVSDDILYEFISWSSDNTIEFTPSSSHVNTYTFNFSASDLNNETVNIPITLSVNISTGLLNVESEDLAIYPNPATDKIELTNSDLYIGWNLQILSVQGTVFYSNKFDGNEINVSNLCSGIYIMKLSNGSELLLKKFIVK